MSAASPDVDAQVVPLSTPSSPLLKEAAPVQDTLLCYVNGKRFELRGADIRPEATLLHFLRQTCHLTGTKLVCGEGGCGACTVLLSKYDPLADRVQHLAVNACLYPLGGLDGCHVITVEGVGNPKVGLHPIQERLAEMNGSQCGFCTPGIVMAFYALVRNNPAPTQAEIEHVLDGNLCRCTGYRPILDAAKSFAADRTAPCAMGANCCRNKKPETDVEEKKEAASSCSSSAPQCSGMKLHSSCTCSKIAALSPHTPSTPLPQAFREDTALIFPPALKKYRQAQAAAPRRLEIRKEDTVWIRPANAQDLLQTKFEAPQAKFVGGNTEAGIDMRFRQESRPWETMVFAAEIPELTRVHADAEGVRMGPSLTLANLQLFLKQQIASGELTAESEQVASSIVTQLHWFAGTQIRNVATLAGNICTASPISDLNPVWQGVKGVTMRVGKFGREQDRIIPGSEFFVGYRRTAMEEQEVLMEVYLPLPRKTATIAAASAADVTVPASACPSPAPSSPSSSFTFTRTFKQSRRRADDIAIVTSCMQMEVAIEDSGFVFQQVRLSYGGMAPATALAHKTAAFLQGKAVSLSTVQSALQVLKEDFPLLEAEVLPGGMAEYRMVLAASFLLKMLYHVWKGVKEMQGSAFAPLMPPFPAEAASAIEVAEREVSAGSQTYKVRETKFDNAKEKQSSEEKKELAAASAVPVAQEVSGGRRIPTERNLVGDPSPSYPHKSGENVRHLSALKQATGEAKYLDDIPLQRDELFLGLVLSTEPHARIVSIDTSAAETHPGWLGFWSAADVPGGPVANQIGDIIHDEELFASSVVPCVGTLIGAVVGRTHIEAKQIASMVKVTYEKLPPIFTIEEAIAAKSFIAPWEEGHKVVKGEVDAAMAAAPFTLEGEAKIGGQEHFYLETMAMIATPGEGGEMHVTGTTQNPSKAQAYVSQVLGVGSHKVVCSVKRLGGGFGGKETRSLHLIAATAVVAQHLQRPVRLVLDRDMDMSVTGQRHAFLGQYKVGFDHSGKILALDAKLYANGGCSADLTMPVMDRALLHVDGAYNIGAVRVQGWACKTNLPSNTAFRGFGGPQGMFIAECFVDAVARKLRISPEQVRARNLYQDGDRTHFGQQLLEYSVPEQWQQLYNTIDFEQKQRACAEFNRSHRYKKRGVSLIPTKFGISFTAKFLNQAGALVLVYSDGTVLVSHGGTEIGQGLNTKMAQVAAHALGIPLDWVTIGDTATDKVPNSSPTAASASSDLNGAAVQNACEQILERLKPLREKNPNMGWKELVNAAYFERIQLSASGFYRTPDVGYDFETGTSIGIGPFNYFTTGVSYSEVEVDVLTGDFTTLHSHLLMDVGAPINPAIDIGQIEGAFAQGLGLFTMEELVWGDNEHKWVRPGHLLTKGPGNYKIPSVNDIPIKLHVELFKDGKNSRAIYSSKGVGEPPLFMGSSVFFAIKAALQAARVEAMGEEEAYNTPFVLHSPATAERIRMAVPDEISKAFMKKGVQPEQVATFQTKGSF